MFLDGKTKINKLFPLLFIHKKVKLGYEKQKVKNWNKFFDGENKFTVEELFYTYIWDKEKYNEIYRRGIIFYRRENENKKIILQRKWET